MAAFDKVASGVPSMDALLDDVRLGDNVVFQVSDLREYRLFVDRFTAQAKRDGRRLVYLRFAQHEPLVSPDDAQCCTLNPDEGFEPFTLAVHRIIEREGRGTFYVFDCLSELQVAWAADLMMGNFFQVTCPFLFQLDTVAFFPILRGCHSFETVARIQETTQLFLDVCSDGESVYLHPIKVWNRYSSTMFMPHRADKADMTFQTLTDAVDVSAFYATLDRMKSEEDLSLDSWERFFQRCRFAPSEEDATLCPSLCRMLMTRDERVRALFGRYFSREDYLRVKERMIGSGRIGGKSCGMLLARRIVDEDLPEVAGRMEPHDSFYVGDHVFYTFLVHNGLWGLRIAQKSPAGYFAQAEALAQGIREGGFPEGIRAMFERTLEYFGQSPIIVRSSSLLEDGFGNAFAGKYESVFCVNQGNADQRLVAFEEAVKTVYASTMDPSALEYRAARGLSDCDEQMSILVQRVSGSMQGDYLYPSAAGVGYSHDLYHCGGRRDSGTAESGMLRLVCGLGTRAVDRTGQDYPRIIHLDEPHYSIASSGDDAARFSQHSVDVLNLVENRIVSVPLAVFVEQAPEWYASYVTDRDRMAEMRLRECGRRAAVRFGTCRGFTENERFCADMKAILATLQNAYGYPVDIEYTVNLAESGRYVICLLQCRPLQTLAETGGAEVPDYVAGDLLFRSTGAAMGMSQCTPIDVAVLVDARAYKALPYREKPTVAQTIARINDEYRGTGKTLMLIAPGRIGTSSPDLGVPLTFSAISQFSLLVEYDDANGGFMPELSFGSHLFQDLVESNIFYIALMSHGDRRADFDFDVLRRCCRRINFGNQRDGSPVVAVYDVSSLVTSPGRGGLMLRYDMLSGKALCSFEDGVAGTE